MSEAEDQGDFVRVASCLTPTEAHTLKGVLEAAGMSAVVADAQLAQAHSWMTTALGGVRVLVPAAQAAQAAEALAQFKQGAFALEVPDEEEDRPTHGQLATQIFSPDKAVLWSFLLTPVFGATLQLVNSYKFNATPRRTRDIVFFVFLCLVTLATMGAVHRLNPGPILLLRTTLVLFPVTVLWYFAVGQDQSRYLISTFGAAFPRRKMFGVAFVVAISELFAGWAIGAFA